MKISEMFQLDRLVEAGGVGSKRTFAGTIGGDSVTINVKLTKQEFDRDEDAAWSGTVVGLLGDTDKLKKGDSVEVFYDKDKKETKVSGKGWKLDQSKKTTPISNEKQKKLV